MPIVKKLLRDDSIVVRFAAASAIGDVKYSGGKYAVKRLLEDDNENVNVAASYAMVRLGYKKFIAGILRGLKSKDQTTRTNAAMMIGKLGDKKNLKLLYEVNRDVKSNYKVKIQAVESMAMLGDESIYQNKLWPLLISKYADDRVMGIRGMGHLNTEESMNAIVTMLQDEVLEVRLYAAGELGRVGDKSGELDVLVYLNKLSGRLDKESAVRADILAAKAIGEIGTEALIKFLPKMLNSRSNAVRLSGARAVLTLTK